MCLTKSGCVVHISMTVGSLLKPWFRFSVRAVCKSEVEFGGFQATQSAMCICLINSVVCLFYVFLPDCLKKRKKEKANKQASYVKVYLLVLENLSVILFLKEEKVVSLGR